MSDAKTTSVMGRRVLAMPDVGSAEAMSSAIAAMRTALETLVSLADAKLAAIRRADAQALLKVAAEEGPALEALLSAEQKRREATAAIARQTGVAGSVRDSAAALKIAGRPSSQDTAHRAVAHNKKPLPHGRGSDQKKPSPPQETPNIDELRVTEVAAYLPQPMASQVGAAAIRLKGLGEELKRKNALVRDVTHGLQAHIRGIFASLASEGEESISYGPNGRESRNRVRTWVDAVG